MDTSPDNSKENGEPGSHTLPLPIHSGLYDDEEVTKPLNELRSRFETDLEVSAASAPKSEDVEEEEDEKKRRRAAALLLGGAGAAGVLGNAGAAGASTLPGSGAGAASAATGGKGAGLAGKIASKSASAKGAGAAGQPAGLAGKGAGAAASASETSASATSAASPPASLAGKGAGAASSGTGTGASATSAASPPASLAGKGAGAASSGTGTGASATSAATSGASAATSGASAATTGAASAASSGAGTAGAAGASSAASSVSQGAFTAIRTAVTNSPKAFAAGGAAVAVAAVAAVVSLVANNPAPPDELAVTEVPAAEGAATPTEAALELIDAIVEEDDIVIRAIIDPDEAPIIVSVDGNVVDQIIDAGIAIGGSDGDGDVSVDLPIEGFGDPDIDIDIDTPVDSIVDPQIDVDADVGPPITTPLEGFDGEIAVVDVVVSEQVISADASIVHVSGNLADASNPETVLDAFDVSIGVVENDGWFVSLLYTAAETARAAADLPFDDVGNGPDPVGAVSPEAAVEQLLEAASVFETDGVISSLPPTEMGAIYAYAPLFSEKAQTTLRELGSDLEFDLEIETLDLSSVETGDVAKVELVGLAATVRIGQETATIDTTSACVVSVYSTDGNICVIYSEDFDTMIDGDVFADVSAIEVDGEWFVSGYPSGLEAALSWITEFNDAAFALDVDPISIISPLIVGGQIPAGSDAEPFLGETSFISLSVDVNLVDGSDETPSSPNDGTLVEGPGIGDPTTLPTVPTGPTTLPTVPTGPTTLPTVPTGPTTLPTVPTGPTTLPTNTSVTLPPVSAAPSTIQPPTLPPVTVAPTTVTLPTIPGL